MNIKALVETFKLPEVQEYHRLLKEKLAVFEDLMNITEDTDELTVTQILAKLLALDIRIADIDRKLASMM